MRLALTIVEGPGAGRRFFLRKERLTIGRAESNDVVLPDAGVSRRHARLERARGGWVLSDDRSANGTELNGLAIGEPSHLASGDRIGIGAVVLRFGPPTAGYRWTLMSAAILAAGLAGWMHHVLAHGRDASRLETLRDVPGDRVAVDTEKSGRPYHSVRAKAAYERGQRKLSERRIAPRNLYDAWAAFAEARDEMEAAPERPAWFDDARRLAGETERDLAKECENLLFRASRFERYGQPEQALRAYREMLLHFPADDRAGCRKKAQASLARAEEGR
jgi:pSer/pThr/pTyr-binding forkhead associated (FHA) protein